MFRLGFEVMGFVMYSGLGSGGKWSFRGFCYFLVRENLVKGFFLEFVNFFFGRVIL